jgi:hypothetical protein
LRDLSPTPSPDAFLQRFLSHVLPNGFVKIRHYGLMASSHATTTLETARALLAGPVLPTHVPAILEGGEDSLLATSPTDRELPRCAVCGACAVVRRPLPEPIARAPPVAA